MADYAIRVENLSKRFKIPHEKTLTLKQAALNLFARKTYEEFTALDDVSFKVKKGEFFGIIGRNGSGKSTLLKILAGIYVPDSGTVSINGKLSPFLELGVGFNPELTGRANILLGGSILGLTRKEIIKKMDKIIDFSELRDFIDMKLKNYSSGMQVRLAFSLAINVHAEILLMDEVLAVGDSNFQNKCLEEFNNYRHQGKTVILVSHDIGTIQRYCNRAMLLRSGKVVKIGKAEDVGNEYLRQNIDDEEARMTKELSVGQEIKEKVKEKKARQVEVIKVEFLDKEGKVGNVFKTGDDFSVRVYFRRNGEVNPLNFGVAIFNQENNCCFAINTVRDKIDTRKYVKLGYFQLNYRNVPLKTNSYFVKVGIFGEADTMVYDFLEKSNYFKYFSKNQNQGIFELDYDWQK